MAFFNFIRDMFGYIPLLFLAGFFGFGWFVTTVLRGMYGPNSFPLPVNLIFFAVAALAVTTLIIT
jgi:hypothetical protein